ncbi:MAG: cupin domain-containing protein, partial [Pseudomonadaceae bacterium]|nr:cupin domain-containing protein [Pseudomonadaceae bacterium]
GFRAPSHAEVLTHFTDFLAQYLSDEQRYGDADLSLPADPAQIDEQTVERLQQLVLGLVQDREALGTWFGRFMTEPRYPELVQTQELDPGLLRELLASGYGLVRNPSARLAWRQEQQDYLMLFASGEHCILPLHLRPLVQLICNGRYLGAEQLAPWSDDAEAMELLQQLLGKGDLLPEQDSENEDDDD